MNQPRSLTLRHAALACILGASTMATAQTGYAQPQWGRPTAPRSGACFYRDPGFRGPSFCVNAGENVAFLSRGMNDQISSIRAFGVTEVTIFQEARFAGRWTRLEGDVRDLRREGWNDRLSSLRVSNGNWRNRGDRGAQNGQYGNRPNGSGLGRIETAPWQDDRADSRDGSGAGGYNPNNRRDGSGAGQYDPQGRGGASGSDRNNAATDRRSGETDDAIVRRVYKEVLQREVDPQGLALYRGHLSNDRWSEQDLRNALMKSPEYAQRSVATPQQNAEQVVARAYRAILGREPDPASRVYVDKVLREQWTEADVSRDLRNSPEYRKKHQ